MLSIGLLGPPTIFIFVYIVSSTLKTLYVQYTNQGVR